jgi:hypothetical protein
MQQEKPLLNSGPMIKPKVKVTAKCILGHIEVLTEAQISEAQKLGAAFCSKCGNPMSARKVEAS